MRTIEQPHHDLAAARMLMTQPPQLDLREREKCNLGTGKEGRETQQQTETAELENQVHRHEHRPGRARSCLAGVRSGSGSSEPSGWSVVLVTAAGWSWVHEQ